ncbi:hypothetical protein ACKKBG_A10915 [Auxenochlorella protothecoides x Auxenochlorella symbiontica]
MGSGQSIEQRIETFAKKNDHFGLQSLLAEIRQRDPNYNANKAQYLDFILASGVTPLIAATQRGNLQCAEVLIAAGADVHIVCPSLDGNSALHEAVSRKQDSLVEVLLQAGANPCVENAKGYTAMDVACSRRNVSVLRLLEQRSPFKGWLYVKTATFAGLSREWKRRWCIVCHRHPYPRAPEGRRLIHVVLLAYRDTEAVAPVCRVWLDGAVATPMASASAQARVRGHGPAQAALKLHHKHEVPAGAYTTGYAGQGLTMYLRPDYGDQAVLDAFSAFIALVNNRGFIPAGANPSSQPVPSNLPATPHGRLADRPGDWGVAAGGAGASGGLGGAPSDEELARRLQEEEDSAFAARLASNPEDHPAASSNASFASSAGWQGSGQAGGRPGPPSPSRTPPPGGALYPRIDYEQRYADQAAPPSPPRLPSSLQSTPSRISAPGTGAGPLGLSALGAAAQAPSSAGAAAGGGPGPAAGPASAATPLISLAEGGAEARPGAAPGAGAGAGEWWSAFPPVPPFVSPGPAAPAATAAASASDAPRPPVASPGAGGGDSEDDGICVVCLEAPATAGFLHGDSVHRCCCRSCAQHLKDQNVRNCPMCREPIQSYIMNVY